MAVLIFRNVVGFLTEILPCAVLCFVPFTARITVERGWFVRVLGSAIAIACAIYTFVGTIPLTPGLHDLRLAVQSVIFMLVLIALFATYIRAIRASFAQKAFVFLLVMGYGFLLTQSEDAVGVLMGMPELEDGYMYPLHKLVILVQFNLVFFWPMLGVMRYVRAQLDVLPDNRTWWRMAALPTALMAVMYFAGWLPAGLITDLQLNSVLTLALSAFALFQYWWVLRSTRAAADDALRRNELEAALQASNAANARLEHELDEVRRDAVSEPSGAAGTENIAASEVGTTPSPISTARPIVLATSSKAISFRAQDVLYIESVNRSRLIHLADGEIATSTLALAQIMERLPQEAFAYCHRSVVVNLARVRKLSRESITLDDGTVLVASRRRYQELVDALAGLRQG